MSGPAGHCSHRPSCPSCKASVEAVETHSLYAHGFLKESRSVCVSGKMQILAPASTQQEIRNSSVNTNDCYFFFFFFYKRVSERGEMLEVALLYTIKLYLCAKTSN